MIHSVTNIPRPTRRRLMRVAQQSSDHQYVRRALAVLALWETQDCVSEAARRVCAARSTVNRWRSLYEEYGEQGLVPRQRGRTQWKSNDEVLKCLESLLEDTPQSLGDLRSRWSSELLAKVLGERAGVTVHPSTVRRWLALLRFGYRRARPTLHVRDPRKAERMQAIEAALASQGGGTEVFYVDEADVDLNPRIGPAWVRRGVQQATPTPGKNRKPYVAGALNARTGRVIWAEYERKSTPLFLGLLHQLRGSYRAAKRIVLIADNYIIHKSQAVQQAFGERRGPAGDGDAAVHRTRRPGGCPGPVPESVRLLHQKSQPGDRAGANRAACSSATAVSGSLCVNLSLDTACLS